MSYSDVKEREKEQKRQILTLCPQADLSSGIYLFLRKSSEGITFFYVGQAKHLLDRLIAHLNGYSQHIDKSIKKYGLWSTSNPFGYKIYILEKTDDLDEREKCWIKACIEKGWQSRNTNLGGQGKGKISIDESRQIKGYRDGVVQGYLNARRDVSKMFKTSLTYSINGKENKNKLKALDKFREFIDLGEKDVDL